ncbi:metallophosphoesterase family protein [Sporosarcina sp. 179-K 3D1 HS]|uniref:metallophosphoesterase family protein n=1 Tax=Sporosarcina sp. 179-K 3D1 HS TaxID=3232169 RepID=UPI0039A336EE
MKIVLLADTHLPSGRNKLPSRLLEACGTADLIIHAGDWKSMQVYEELSQYAEVIGVSGNVDDEDIRRSFPLKQTVEVSDYRIGIVHGHGEGKTTEKRALEAFEDEAVDIIVFGHSHIPMMRYAGKTLMINPGSPTAKRKLPNYSFCILHIEQEVRVEFVFL